MTFHEVSIHIMTKNNVYVQYKFKDKKQIYSMVKVAVSNVFIK